MADGRLLKIRFKEANATLKKRGLGFALERCGVTPHLEGKANRLSDSLRAKASRIFPTLGSDSYATRNGEYSLSCALNGVSEVKKLKRAKLECEP